LLFVFLVQSASPQSVITVENADSLVGRVLDGQPVRELIGNVRFSQENVRVTCDRALQYLETGKLHLTGNVIVRDDSVELRSPRGVYHRDQRRAEAFDSVRLEDGVTRVTARYGEYYIESQRAAFKHNVKVTDTGSVLTSDSLTFLRAERRTIAVGNVSIYNIADNVTITGERFENLARDQFSRMTGDPMLFQLDRGPGGRVDTLVVRSRVMESYQDSVRRLVAIDSVEILRGDLSAVAGYAVFYTAADSILLRQSPIVWYGNSQVSGEAVTVYLVERKLNRVLVLGDAFAISQSQFPERFDQLTGRTLEMQFTDQELERIRVDDRAISVYHLYEDSLGNGLNRTSGDRIVMSFAEGKVAEIRIFGGVEGQYVPENLVKGREREHSLAGFNWRWERPRMARGNGGAPDSRPDAP